MGKRKMNDTYIIMTLESFWGIDTIISGHDASTHAARHVAYLKGEYGINPRTVRITGNMQAVTQAVAAVEARLDARESFGRKAMRLIASETGAALDLVTMKPAHMG